MEEVDRCSDCGGTRPDFLSGKSLYYERFQINAILTTQTLLYSDFNSQSIKNVSYFQVPTDYMFSII